ncbi:hypothetical protein KVR01_012237 [Diaporthe batatas]|uniref:uncharacterized protein n=1 Tax=Diaporthe batatas TaxID=748121 RepID=UPI001D03741D|nr:uncharacterized protein KVR01_012237 [Diaporthe batatas]KAG8157965.1 hypothetical protein KVR01_012237 [Diaporthe batatas]
MQLFGCQGKHRFVKEGLPRWLLDERLQEKECCSISDTHTLHDHASLFEYQNWALSSQLARSTVEERAPHGSHCARGPQTARLARLSACHGGKKKATKRL